MAEESNSNTQPKAEVAAPAPSAPPPAEASKPAAAPAAPAGGSPAPDGGGSAATSSPAPEKSKKISEVLGKVKASFSGVKSGGKLILSLPREFFLGIKEAFWGGGWGLKVAFLGFVFSLFLVVKTGQQIWGLYQKEIAAKYNKAVEKVHQFDPHAEVSPKTEIEPSHGMFLDRLEGTLSAALGESRAFEIDLYIECDSEETKKQLEAKRWALQEYVEPLLKDQHPDELMTEKGKEVLKTQILKGVNAFIEKEFKGKSKAVRVYFTRFVLA